MPRRSHAKAGQHVILSFETDGTPRFIEVKATTAPDLRLGFYITANELDRASTATNYHLYFVFGAMTKKPKVLPLKSPDLKGTAYLMRPLNFHVTTTSNSQA